VLFTAIWRAVVNIGGIISRRKLELPDEISVTKCNLQSDNNHDCAESGA